MYISYRIRQNYNSKRNSGTNAGNKQRSRDSYFLLPLLLPPVAPSVLILLRLVIFSSSVSLCATIKRKQKVEISDLYY